jgi:hypothetical protein
MTKTESLIQLLNNIDKKSKAIPRLGVQINAITPKIQIFDLLIFSVLNRTVNLNKAFVSSMNDNNFIAAAPLIRINLDSLLRMYAARISEYSINDFAQKVLDGEHIRRMKYYDSKEKLNDTFLVSKLSGIKNMDWVKKVYESGNSYVHFCDKIVFSSQQIESSNNRTINFTIGEHDNFISIDEKIVAAIWMNKIIDSIIEQTQIWVFEKCKSVGLNIEKLNDENFINERIKGRSTHR